MASTVTDRRGHTPSRVTTTTATIGTVVRAGALATVTAAVATVVFALLAGAIDVPLEVDGEEIPAGGFAFGTVIGSVVGVGLALSLARWAKRPARTFVVTTVVLTVLSMGPVVGADATTATQVTLALAHVLAAAIVIPAIALRLPKSNRP